MKNAAAATIGSYWYDAQAAKGSQIKTIAGAQDGKFMVQYFVNVGEHATATMTEEMTFVEMRAFKAVEMIDNEFRFMSDGRRVFKPCGCADCFALR